MYRPMPVVEGVEHRDVIVDGVRLHVAEAGAGPPLLLQHGWPQHWWMWRGLIGPLAAGHRVICPDLRGFGWSQAPVGGYDKERLASDLIGVLDALGLDRVGLVGHDWGGFAGFLACLRAPDRFSGFVALSILHPWPAAGRVPDPRRLARLWYQALVASPLLGERLVRDQAVMKRLLGRAARGVWDAEALAEYTGSLARSSSARASVSLYRTFLLHELVPLTRGRYAEERLTVPTRLIVGERDPVVTADVIAGFEGHADDMSAESVPGAGHWLPEERAQLVAGRIGELLG
jgi:pimeloyl-ACP methyl ester carboxylesterase